MTCAPAFPAAILGKLMWLAWQCVRLPILVFLSILEPVVRFVAGSMALLGVLIAFFWWSLGVPHFPFFRMMGTSLAIGALPLGHRALRRLVGG